MIYIPLLLYLFIYSVLVTSLSPFQVKEGKSQDNLLSYMESLININDEEDDISNDPFQKSWEEIKNKTTPIVIFNYSLYK